MSILSLHDVSLMLAGNAILQRVNWQIQPQERIALVGRNGAGKSTLLKLLTGEIVQDGGQIQRVGGLSVAGLTQDVSREEQATVYHFLVKGLGSLGDVLSRLYDLTRTTGSDTLIADCHQQLDSMQAWDKLPLIDTMASHLQIDKDAQMSALSGGMKRRVLLAAALIAEPDLLLLDEPTNHLDIEAIEWLESVVKNYRGSVVVITHDRRFLAQVATKIVEIDRGQLHSYACDYETFLDRREARLLSEKKQDLLFDKRLSDEEAWIRTGIKARRTRNEGRVRALKAMREAFKQRRMRAGQITQKTLDTCQVGQLVLEAKHLKFSLKNRVLIDDLSLLVTRGDKIAIMGPNGCGKTTLVRLLLGEIAADSGRLRRSDALSIAYFDQLRRQLNEQETVMANVADGADHVTIDGKKKHVASYLQDFLFSPDSFQKPLSSLSGGEKNRLLLAKIFAKPANLLVLDEPTNDLDIESLEFLETLLVNYPGTVLLISHDRAFVNQVVSSVLVYEGMGHFVEHLGDYDDYLAYKKQRSQQIPLNREVPRSATSARRTNKLSFNEQRELAQLPQDIDSLEQQIAELQLQMADPTFYQQEDKTIGRYTEQLALLETKLSQHYVRWEQLEAKKSG